MPRKVVRVYFPKELKPYLDDLQESLGLSESEILRNAFLEYYKKYSVIIQTLPRPP